MPRPDIAVLAVSVRRPSWPGVGDGLMFKMLGSRTRAAALSLAVVGAVGVGAAALNPPVVRSQELSPQARKALEAVRAQIRNAEFPADPISGQQSIVLITKIGSQLSSLSPSERVQVITALQNEYSTSPISTSYGSMKGVVPEVAASEALGALLDKAMTDLTAGSTQEAAAVDRYTREILQRADSNTTWSVRMSPHSLLQFIQEKTIAGVRGSANFSDAAVAKLLAQLAANTTDPVMKQTIAETRRVLDLQSAMQARLEALVKSDPTVTQAQVYAAMAEVAREKGLIRTGPAAKSADKETFEFAASLLSERVLNGELGLQARNPNVLAPFRQAARGPVADEGR